MLVDLPASLVVHTLSLSQKGEVISPQRCLATVALACRALAKIVQSPILHQEVLMHVYSLLGDDAGDPTRLLQLLSGPCFARSRVIDIMGLNRVSTALMNKAKFRASLPCPPFTHLRHLALGKCRRGTGCLALVWHTISILPRNLRTLSLQMCDQTWLSQTAIQQLAKSCPNIQGLDLSWHKVKTTWPDVLHSIVINYPGLRVLDISYAGYPAGPYTNADFERLLTPIGELKELRCLNISHLGLDGTLSHTGTSSDTQALRSLLSKLHHLSTLLSVDTQEKTHKKHEGPAFGSFVSHIRSEYSNCRFSRRNTPWSEMRLLVD